MLQVKPGVVKVSPLIEVSLPNAVTYGVLCLSLLSTSSRCTAVAAGAAGAQQCKTPWWLMAMFVERARSAQRQVGPALHTRQPLHIAAGGRLGFSHM